MRGPTCSSETSPLDEQDDITYKEYGERGEHVPEDVEEIKIWLEAARQSGEWKEGGCQSLSL